MFAIISLKATLRCKVSWNKVKGIDLGTILSAGVVSHSSSLIWVDGATDMVSDYGSKGGKFDSRRGSAFLLTSLETIT